MEREKPNSLQYVSLMSPGFSGSTLLSMLLCSQPRSIGFGDTYFGKDSDPKNLCTCGVPFVDCPPRVETQAAIRNGGVSDFSWGTATAVPTPTGWSYRAQRYWPLSKAISLKAVRLLPAALRRQFFSAHYLETRLMLSALADSGQYDYYFDGCKDPIRLELLRTEIPDIKVVQMVRHPGAYLWHFHRLGERRHGERLRQWTRYHRRVRSFRNKVGADQYLAITYENVVEDPGAFLRSIAEFLEMPAVFDTPPVPLRREHIHIQGNKMRKTADQVLNLANTWRGQLPKEMEDRAHETLARMPWAAALFDA